MSPFCIEPAAFNSVAILLAFDMDDIEESEEDLDAELCDDLLSLL
jgi:hypothetical protein